MPFAAGPVPSLHSRGRDGDALLFGRGRGAWVGALCRAAIGLFVGGVALASASRENPFAWVGAGFVLVFLLLLARAELTRYELRLEKGRLRRTWTPLLGRPVSETLEAADLKEIHLARGRVSSVTMVMKDDRRLELDRGVPAEPLETLARELKRALDVPLRESA